VPEGHTIHHCAQEHARLFVGRRLHVSSPQGRFPDAAVVDGAVMVATDAWGKHLFHEYEGERFVHVHLGIYGNFTAHPLPAPEPRPTTRMRIVSDEVAVDLIGPTRCELLDTAGRDAVVARLGPDPLRKDADPERVWRALQKRRITIGQALMDQSVIAGVGNVFRAEALWTHRISPERPCHEVSRSEFDAIWKTLRKLLRKGVREQRISTRNIYRKEACPECGTPIRRWDLAGRWAYACPTCQPT
jgi:endonuclease VIII